MEYKTNFGMWDGAFAVPGVIVDKELKNLNECELKSLLCILRCGGDVISLEKISEMAGFSKLSVQNALEKLSKSGLISSCVPSESGTQKKRTPVENRIVNEIKYQRPNTAYIAERMKNSKDINVMMQEAQVILSRPLSTGDSAVLLALHDNDGLPVDVILMLLQYAVSVGKVNMKYIGKTGESWAEEGIDNLQKAEKKIEELSRKNLIWKKFENLIGIEHRSPTATESEAVTRWFDSWGFDENMIKEAYDRCVNMNGKYVLKYMDSIVKRWHNQGITRIEQALMENQKRSKTKSVNAGSRQTASYSIEEYESYNILDYIN